MCRAREALISFNAGHLANLGHEDRVKLGQKLATAEEITQNLGSLYPAESLFMARFLSLTKNRDLHPSKILLFLPGYAYSIHPTAATTPVS